MKMIATLKISIIGMLPQKRKQKWRQEHWQTMWTVGQPGMNALNKRRGNLISTQSFTFINCFRPKSAPSGGLTGRSPRPRESETPDVQSAKRRFRLQNTRISHSRTHLGHLRCKDLVDVILILSSD